MNNEQYIEPKILKEYILKNYRGLFTSFEEDVLHINRLIEKTKNYSDFNKAKIQAREFEKFDQLVLNTAQDDIDSFLEKVALRILKDNENSIFINRCTKCQKIVRTPNAKQCNWCFHKW